MTSELLQKESEEKTLKKVGRPRGKKMVKTLERAVAKKRIDERVIAATDPLINAQLTIALGINFLYKIEKEWIKLKTSKNGKEDGYWRNKKPVLVVSQLEIEDYLEHIVDLANGDIEDEFDPSATYYFITTKEPNNEAIKDLLNRVHGKPRETIDVTGEVKFSLKGLAQMREEQRAKVHEGKITEAIVSPENNQQ